MYWYFQENQCSNIKKHAIHNINRLAWTPICSWTLGSCPACSCVKTALLYQGHHDRNHKLWNILHMQVLLECCYKYMESSQWENWNNFFCHKVLFLTLTVNFKVLIKVWVRPSCICGILYFNGIDVINKINKLRII